jgi:hypothetical protein
MAKPKVLLLGDIDHAHESWNALAELAVLVKPEARSRAEFIQECKSGKLEGVLVIYRTFGSFDITGRIDEEILAVFPETVKFICHNGECLDVNFLYIIVSVLQQVHIHVGQDREKYLHRPIVKSIGYEHPGMWAEVISTSSSL